MQLPAFRQIVATESFRMLRPVYATPPPPPRTGRKVVVPVVAPPRTLAPRDFTNRNRLLREWPLCDGIKTGYTHPAGRCLAASATQGGWRVIAVVLKSQNAWQDARTLLEWAFSHYQQRTVVRAGQGGWSTPVVDGLSPQVDLVAGSALGAVVPRGGRAPQMRARAVRAMAPVARGQRLGVLEVMAGDRVMGRVALCAAGSVELSVWGRVKRLAFPDVIGKWLLCLSAGVLLLGTAAKTARARRARLAPGGRATDATGPGDGGRADRDGAWDQGRSASQ